MATNTTTIKARCLCGNFTTDIPVGTKSLPLSAWMCHCDTCRRSSGTLCTTYLLPDNPSFQPDPSLLGRLKGYKSSENITRYFCPTCGCHVLWNGPEQDTWDIPTGCLEKIDDVIQFKGHIYVKDTVDGGSADFITQHAGNPLSIHGTGSDSQELAPGWRNTSEPQSVDQHARLHAHCACSGISFYIARPSTTSSDTAAPHPDVLVPSDSGPPNSHENETWWLRAYKNKFLGGMCVCDSCRLVTGFEFVQWAFVPTSDITLDPAGKIPFSRSFGSLASYRSSDKATRHFCKDCGATVFWDGDIRPGLIDVAVGLLDAPEGSRAESWLEWATEKVSFREDAEHRSKSLLEAAERGLGEWGKTVQGREGPHEKFLEAHDGQIQS